MKIRKRILIKGTVQGVGFRPKIYNLATSLGIKGTVSNTNAGVVIDAEADEKTLKLFIEKIKTEKPEKAIITSLSDKQLKPKGYKDFKITKSKAGKEKSLLITPDLSICDDCLHELFDASNRRYRYPFTTCINCGPRFSILEKIPYDRTSNTMRHFETCRACEWEYVNPAERRFHSETNSCSICGPELFLYGKNGERMETEDTVTKTIELIKKGKIIAIKGLGGFHLVCDAENDGAVKELRKRKGRSKKPFALMSFNITKVKKFCVVTDIEEELLLSKARPIVLLKKLQKSSISNAVSPGLNTFGVMLPYTPLHYLILKEGFLAIVATSGNKIEEPIASSIEEARRDLKDVADYFLDHNRDIVNRIDDSIVKVINDKESLIRRARGYVPSPIKLPQEVKEVLAVGGELKNTFCLTKGIYAFVSQHIGDLKSFVSLEHFEKTIKNFKNLFGIKPRVVAYDMHPEYMSSKYAEKLKGVKKVKVQHHHAHIASCMAENELNEKVIGIALDGTGYGEDGLIWGGEFLVVDFSGFDRLGHLKYIMLQGGDAAANEPWRTAVSFLYNIYGKGLSKENKFAPFSFAGKRKIESIADMIDKKVNTIPTSSMGRLFDAVSSTLGICHENSYEGQAAMELEAQVDENIIEFYDWHPEEEGGVILLDGAELLKAVLDDLKRGIKIHIIASKFHNAVASGISSIAIEIRKLTRLNKVCLSGGCFQNKFLAEKVVQQLESNNFRVYTQSKVPTNDGGISLGQAMIANAII